MDYIKTPEQRVEKLNTYMGNDKTKDIVNSYCLLLEHDYLEEIVQGIGASIPMIQQVVKKNWCSHNFMPISLAQKIKKDIDELGTVTFYREKLLPNRDDIIAQLSVKIDQLLTNESLSEKILENQDFYKESGKLLPDYENLEPFFTETTRNLGKVAQAKKQYREQEYEQFKNIVDTILVVKQMIDGNFDVPRNSSVAKMAQKNIILNIVQLFTNLCIPRSIPDGSPLRMFMVEHMIATTDTLFDYSVGAADQELNLENSAIVFQLLTTFVGINALDISDEEKEKKLEAYLETFDFLFCSTLETDGSKAKEKINQK